MGREISIICGDGAIRGGFIAGAISRLLEVYPEPMSMLHTITASSASVGSMFYFLSHGQKHPGRSIWTRELSSPEFINYHGFKDFFKNEPVYNIDYMTNVVFKKNNPIDKETVLNSKTNFFFPVYNTNLQRIEIFTNRVVDGIRLDNKYPYEIRYIGDHDIYRLIAASNAAPFVYDRTVQIGDYHYIDAAAWMPFLLDVPGIRSTKKIVIVTKFDNSLRRTINYQMMGYVFPFLFIPFRKNILPLYAYFQYGSKPATNKKMAAICETLRKFDELVVISPSERLGAQTDNSHDTLDRNFSQGYNMIDKMKSELDQFFFT